jgi:hypothetical protein
MVEGTPGLAGAHAQGGQAGAPLRLAVLDRDSGFLQVLGKRLDRLHEVKERRDQAQVGGDRRLRGQQREDRLVDLQVAAIDDVVAGDDELRELRVVVLDRFDRPVQLGGDQLEPVEGARLESIELLAIFGA